MKVIINIHVLAVIFSLLNIKTDFLNTGENHRFLCKSVIKSWSHSLGNYGPEHKIHSIHVAPCLQWEIEILNKKISLNPKE